MIADVFNVSYWLTCRPAEELSLHLEEILNNCGFNVMSNTDHRFQPQGYTALWLLSESHLALHTFPEDNKAYIELCSCNKEKLTSFVEAIENHQLLGKEIETRYKII